MNAMCMDEIVVYEDLTLMDTVEKEYSIYLIDLKNPIQDL